MRRHEAPQLRQQALSQRLLRERHSAQLADERDITSAGHIRPPEGCVLLTYSSGAARASSLYREDPQPVSHRAARLAALGGKSKLSVAKEGAMNKPWELPWMLALAIMSFIVTLALSGVVVLTLAAIGSAEEGVLDTVASTRNRVQELPQPVGVHHSELARL